VDSTENRGQRGLNMERQIEVQIVKTAKADNQSYRTPVQMLLAEVTIIGEGHQ